MHYSLKELFAPEALKQWFIENWINILIIIAFTVAGYFLGFQVASAKYQEYILQNLTQETNKYIFLTNYSF